MTIRSQRSVHSVITGAPSQVEAPYSFDPETIDADGGWIASPIDLVRLVSALDGSNPPTILAPEIVALMTARPELEVWQDQSEYYGMGWLIYADGDEADWWHGGNLPGTASLLIRTHRRHIAGLRFSIHGPNTKISSLVRSSKGILWRGSQTKSPVGHPATCFPSTDMSSQR